MEIVKTYNIFVSAKELENLLWTSLSIMPCLITYFDEDEMENNTQQIIPYLEQSPNNYQQSQQFIIIKTKSNDGPFGYCSYIYAITENDIINIDKLSNLKAFW